MWIFSLFPYFLLCSFVVGQSQFLQDVQWSPCPVYSNISVSVKTGEGELTADCTNLTLPLDWTSTSSTKTIQLFVKRVNSASGNRKGQVWLLEGGPGGSGAGLEGLIPGFSKLLEDYDIMLPDHRGTGRSSALWCPEIDNLVLSSSSKSNFKECVAYLSERYGDDLHYFTTTNAAFDLKAAINLTATIDDKVNIYGLSYGSYWAQRYMVVAPDQADRITIDGVCPPDVCRFADYYDINTNIVGSDFMTLCGEESQECRDNLGEFPMESLAMLMELAQSGKDDCTTQLNITVEYLRGVFFLSIASEQLRVIIAPLVHRLLRCNSEDKKEIQKMKAYFEMINTNKSQVNQTFLSNPLIFLNIALSEMYSIKSPPPNENFYIGLDKTLFFSYDLSTTLASTYPYWNKYDPTQSKGFNEYPTSKTPLLLLNGELDPQTSHAWFVHTKEYYTSPSQHYVSVPYAVHGTVPNSPVTDSPFTCGLLILANFFLNGEVDTNCLDALEKIDFSGNSQTSKQLSVQVFGSPNLWT